ncbi:hypothetical protein QUF80_05445 [Desulfococcaceae bacterium HSG8]|nr:hypothetical protein [Desulfococcaceae bacterium HSG8]
MSQHYIEKLKDPRWQKKRLEIFGLDNWKCLVCGSSDKKLCVHHARYRVGREPWDHETNDLLTLCADCHALARDDSGSPSIADSIRRIIGMSPLFADIRNDAVSVINIRGSVILNSECADVPGKMNTILNRNHVVIWGKFRVMQMLDGFFRKHKVMMFETMEVHCLRDIFEMWYNAGDYHTGWYRERRLADALTTCRIPQAGLDRCRVLRELTFYLARGYLTIGRNFYAHFKKY